MSSNPRVKVTLSPETYTVVKALADAGGTSMSKVIGELIESVSPHLARTYAFLSAAEESDDETRDSVIAAIESIEDSIVRSVGPERRAGHRYLAEELRRQRDENVPPKPQKGRKSR